MTTTSDLIRSAKCAEALLRFLKATLGKDLRIMAHPVTVHSLEELIADLDEAVKKVNLSESNQKTAVTIDV